MKKRFSIISLPALWVVLEFIRENIPVYGFGWNIIGYSQYKNYFFIQITDILGAKGLSFVILTINLIIFQCLVKKTGCLRRLLYGSIILIVCFSYGVYRSSVFSHTEREVCVNIVQPNIPQMLKWMPGAREGIIKKLIELGKKGKENCLLVYPEASWPDIVDVEDPLSFVELARKVHRNILIGAVIKENEKFYNAALLLDKEGSIKEIYRKIKLVPFGEYVPLRRIFSFIEVLNELGDISRGEEYTRFGYRNSTFGVLICFEDVFPLLVRRQAMGNDFLVNITNDAWFYGYPEVNQHMAVMVLRAVENRESIVRCANTGISGYVDYTGRVYFLSVKGRELFVEGNKTFRVPSYEGRSVYNRWGEWFSLVCFVFLIFVAVKEK